MSQADQVVKVDDRRTINTYSTFHSFVVVYDADKPKSSIQGRPGLLAELTHKCVYCAAVYDVLNCHGNRAGEWSMPQSAIAAEAGCSLASAKRAIKALEQEGVISIELTKKGGGCTYHLEDIPARYEKRDPSSVESEGVALERAGGSSVESEGVALVGATDHPNDHLTLPSKGPGSEEDKSSSGESNDSPRFPFFMGAWRQGYASFYGNSPSKGYMNKTGNQIKQQVYAEFENMTPEQIIKGVALFWGRKEDQPVEVARIIDKFKHTVNCFCMVLRHIAEENAENRTGSDRIKAEQELREKARSRALSMKDSLNYKIDDWIEEECSLGMARNPLGRLVDWLEALQWEDDDVSRLAKKSLKTWAMEQIDKRKPVVMARINEQNPVLWAKLIKRDNPFDANISEVVRAAEQILKEADNA